MALQDFYGTYQVTTASGTEFGVDSEVDIGQAVDGSVSLTVSSAFSSGKVMLSGTYDNQADALRFPLQNDQVMYVSRYVDSDPSKDYRSIYGILITPNPAAATRIRLPVWSAEALSAPSTGGNGNQEVSDDPLTQSDFVGEYFIRTTADSQFGVASGLSITESSSNLVGEITNALGTSVMSSDLYYDSGTVSVTRDFTSTVMGPSGSVEVRTVFAMSIATEETNGVETTYGYGIVTVGDPQQAGTFGGEEGGP